MTSPAWIARISHVSLTPSARPKRERLVRVGLMRFARGFFFFKQTFYFTFIVMNPCRAPYVQMNAKRLTIPSIERYSQLPSRPTVL